MKFQEETQPAATDRLRAQSATVGEDLRELGRVTKEVARQKLGHVRGAASQYVEQGRKQLGDMERHAEAYVRKRPVTSIALAASAGILLGYLFSRRR